MQSAFGTAARPITLTLSPSEGERESAEERWFQATVQAATKPKIRVLVADDLGCSELSGQGKWFGIH